MPWPPTPDTLADFNVGTGANPTQYSGFDRAVATAVIALQTAMAAGTGVKRAFIFTYDFAVLGGSIGSKTLTAPNGALPAGFIIQNASYEVVTPFTGAAGCEVAMSTGIAAGDLFTADTLANNGLDMAGWIASGVAITTPNAWKKTITARSPVLVISVGAVTAGKLDLYLEGTAAA